MIRKKLLFIINPISGGRKKDTLASLIQSYLNRDRFDYSIKYTAYAGHAASLAKDHKHDHDIIVAVGGDGTINEIAQELKDATCCLGIIPQGSGNGLARHLGLSMNPGRSIQQINEAEQIIIDTAEMNGHFFVSIAGIGFDSLIAELFTESKSRGFWGYASLSTKEFFKYQEKEYHICIDGEWIERKAFLVAFANSNQFGYNTKISPQASLQDGFLDVCIIRKPRLDQMPLGLWQIWSSKAHESGLLEIIHAREIKISPHIFEFANIDGESKLVGHEIEVKMNPQSLKVWVPKG